MRKPRIKIKTKHILFFLIIVSFLTAYFFPGVGDNETIQTSLTFVGLLFGIIVGFFITDLYTRYQGIRSNAAIDSSCLTTYYSFCKILGENRKNKRWLEKQRVLINNYIRRFMPLPWERYEATEKEFSEIVGSLREIRYDEDRENETYSNILAVVSQHSDAREKLIMYGKDRLAWAEWLVVLLLGGLLLFSLFYVKDDSSTSIIFTGTLSSAILILLFFVRDLNNLNFGENAVSISPYERVLDAIGKPRYYKSKGEVI